MSLPKADYLRTLIERNVTDETQKKEMLRTVESLEKDITYFKDNCYKPLG